MEIGANLDGAFAYRSTKAPTSSLPEVTIFYHTLKGLYLVKFVWFYTIQLEQKTLKLYQSAPLENNDLEQRLEKKLNDMSNFNNSGNNIKEMITYFKDENHYYEKKYKK